MGAAERTPSVVVSHVDIVYRVFGSRARTGERPPGLRGMLSRGDRAPRQVHAVKDVSFVGYHGQSIGIIGRNGSGKSTILRAIAGLIPPTSGHVWADGSPALLGVNAVLEKSLSGARNVYIGAQALGLSKAEVDAKFDEIADFADIGDAIHLPMSTYSSGMAARLRFAISTAARPGVLIIDEALSTGDAAFRERSAQRIEELRGEAGTVFLVSHSANTIREMCDRAIWLDRGELIADGPVDDVVDAYEEAGRRGTIGPIEIEQEVAGVERWAGRDRYAVSATTSARAVEPRPERVLVAGGTDLAVALAAVPTAVRSNSPLLLVRSRSVPPVVLAELRRLAPDEVVVVGDPQGVGDSVVEALEKAGLDTRRVPGVDAQTVVATLARDEAPTGRPVFVVPARDEAAALSAALRAVEVGGTVLVVGTDGVDPEVLDTLRALRPSEVHLLVERADLAASVTDVLAEAAGVRVQRHLSPSPAEVAVAASEHHRENVDVVYVASAPADAVTGTLVAAQSGMPLLLVDRDAVPEPVHDALKRLRPAHVVVLGGVPSVSTAVRQQLVDYVVDEDGDEASRLEDSF
ncbi:ATP-binding cassette domain-containing protein [Arthrobacter sp. NEB 688]|uniref:ATP-binding cassette domain-containing protein n=1 Tax=Arthrobacter sp. NEB 688 TaxID=904039 RepID=UPI0015657C09|nr:ATP-binding cassette domain-containing protein [Arthrobacter sp. NEB 688]QKE85534.1 ATP-binding cassette domain-containing protein [Arthrobacter sp. NEB 688]